MPHAIGTGDRGSDANRWRGPLAGLCASLVGIGLARFAYTPLIPVLIAAGWFQASEVVYLGAANLAGYLGGALLARPLAARLPAASVLRAMMVLATVAFFTCAWPLSFSWYFLWRFASGLAGGTLMVLAPATALAGMPASRQGLAGGIIFTGVGLGIAASGTLVPFFLGWGLIWTWYCLGGISALLTIVAWNGWPSAATVRPPPPTRPAPSRSQSASLALKSLYLEYGLNAAGLVPHMIFLVDFVARDLDRGLHAGAQAWILFGLGAIAGPLLAGRLADRIGFRAALRVAFLLQAAGVGWLAVASDPVALAISSIVIGAFVPGIVPLVLGHIRDLAPDDPAARVSAWGFATTAFALGQAGAAYGFSFLYVETDSYQLLFGLGASAFVVALALDLAQTMSGRRAGS